MDDFVKDAFDKATKNADMYNRFLEDFETITPTVMDIFVRNIGEDKARDFIESLTEESTKMIVLLNFIFHIAGRIMYADRT